MADDFVPHDKGNQMIGYVERGSPDEVRIVADDQPFPVTGTVTITGALPAGDNNIGNVDVVTLPALPAGTNNIGDVDVLTLPITFGSGAIAATTPRIALATDSPGVGSLTTLATNTTPLVPGGQGGDSTATAGTPEQLNGGSSQACRLVMLTNIATNPIAYGFSSAVDVALKVGTRIPSGKTHPIPCTNLNQVYVDGTDNGAEYTWSYWT